MRKTTCQGFLSRNGWHGSKDSDKRSRWGRVSIPYSILNSMCANFLLSLQQNDHPLLPRNKIAVYATIYTHAN